MFKFQKLDTPYVSYDHDSVDWSIVPDGSTVKPGDLVSGGVTINLLSAWQQLRHLLHIGGATIAEFSPLVDLRQLRDMIDFADNVMYANRSDRRILLNHKPIADGEVRDVTDAVLSGKSYSEILAPPNDLTKVPHIDDDLSDGVIRADTINRLFAALTPAPCYVQRPGEVLSWSFDLSDKQVTTRKLTLDGEVIEGPTVTMEENASPYLWTRDVEITTASQTETVADISFSGVRVSQMTDENIGWFNLKSTHAAFVLNCVKRNTFVNPGTSKTVENARHYLVGAKSDWENQNLTFALSQISKKHLIDSVENPPTELADWNLASIREEIHINGVILDSGDFGSY